MHHLRSGLLRGLGGSLNSALYEQTLTDTKHLISSYHKEVSEALDKILSTDAIDATTKLEYFAHCRHSYGKTALLLSGGIGMAGYHMGVVQALHEAHLLPNIICGSSAGSMIAALVATSLPEELAPRLAQKWIQGGHMDYKKKG